MQRRIESRMIKAAVPISLLLALAVPVIAGAGPASGAAKPVLTGPAAAPRAAAALLTASGLDVFVGYAEDKEINTPDPAAFPVPWTGAPNTTFLGNTVPGQTACGTLTVCYDTGAIRLDNPGTSPVTVTNVIVDMHSSISGGKLFKNLWGTFTVNPGQSVILAANPPATNPSYDNFDTSGYPPNQCTPVTVAPTVTITANGVTTQLADSSHVLDTGGIDAGFCKHNESIQWRAIGAPGVTDATLSLGPATVTEPLGQPAAETATVLDGSGVGLPNVAVNFSVTSGPDAGTTGTAYTNASGQAIYQLQGTGQGEDVVAASVTTVGSFKSGQTRVMWTDGSAANWSSTDIGTPAVTGSQSYSAGADTWTVSGGGSGVSGTADQFHYAWQPGTGAAAEVTSQTAPGPAEAGVMLRASTDPGAPFYGALVSPGGTVTVQDRGAQGGGVITVATAQAAPGAAYLWVTGSAGSYTAYESADGYTWVPVPGSTASLSLGASPLAGLAVTSGSAASGNTATLISVALPAGPPAPAPPEPCPAPWTCADIGSPSPAGSQSFDPNSNAWTIQAGGADITGTADQFRYVWQTLSGGGGSVVAYVASQANTSSGAKAGVMVRTSTDPASPEYSLVVSPGQGVKVQVRKTQGGSTSKIANPAGTTPAWLKISWSGSAYSAYTSADGASWTLIPGSTTNLSLGTAVLAGLAVTSHHDGTLGTVVMNGVTAG